MTADIAAALGMAPRAKNKVYLTVAQIVSYGVVLRGPGEPRVTAEEVQACITALGLRPHAVGRDGQPVYDPVPIRKELS